MNFKKIIAGSLLLAGMAFSPTLISKAGIETHTAHDFNATYSNIKADISLGNLNTENSYMGEFSTGYVIPAYELFAIYKNDFLALYNTLPPFQTGFNEWEGDVSYFIDEYITEMGHINCCLNGTYSEHSNKFSRENCRIGYLTYNLSVNQSFHGVDLHVAYETDKTPPTLTGTNLFTVNVDNMLTLDEILSHVTVTDETDSNPVIEIISSNYDSSSKVLGDFSVVIRGKDSSGNTSANYTITIRVVDTTKPVIVTNTNIENQPNNVKLSQEELKAQFSFSDNYYASDELTLSIVRDDYTEKWNKPGVYLVSCKATDPSDNTSSIATMSVSVIDKTPPTITGSDVLNQPNNVKLSNDDLLVLFTAKDDVELKQKYLTSDDYTENWNKPGTYAVECAAQDATNRVTATIHITVVDAVAPEVTGSNITKSYAEKIEDLKTLFTASDDITATDELSFQILEDNYTANYNVKGSHTVKVAFTDAAGNTTEATSTITVVDNVKPVITVPTKIEVANNLKLTDSDLRAKINVVDEYDGRIIDYEISDPDSYLSNYKKVGSYIRVITAKDSSNNSQTATITIEVVDKTAPEVFFDSYFIIIQVGEELTETKLRSYACQTLSVQDEDIVSITGTYNIKKIGKYPVHVKLANEEEVEITISVTDSQKVVNEFEKKEGFFSFEDYTTKLLDFANWKAWTFWVWLTWVGVGIVLLSALYSFAYRKRRRR